MIIPIKMKDQSMSFHKDSAINLVSRALLAGYFKIRARPIDETSTLKQCPL